MSDLKIVYDKIKDNYISVKDSFYDTDIDKFHLIVAAECIAYADCMMIIADELINQELKKESKR